MVTIKDIAEKAQVAVSTVSYALNNDPRIPEETRQRVLQVAQELGYVGKSGKKRSSGAIRQIVMCLPSMNGDIYTNIVNSIRSVLNVSNCELLLYVGRHISRIKWMDGLFVLNPHVTTADIEEATRKRIPVVMMDRGIEIEGTTTITLDNFRGCYDTTKALINKGAKTFAFVGGPNESYESQDRYRGFIQALNDAQLNRKETIVLQSDLTCAGGVNVSRYLLELPKLPDAIVCANDETVKGIHDGLASKGLEDKVLLSGFDGITPRYPFHYITATAEHKHWGAIAAYSMLQMLDNVKTEQKIKIPVEIVEYY